MQYILYVLVVLFATFVGSSIGLGGGVIIKPLLDMLKMDKVQIINIYSSIAVFSMAITSLLKSDKTNFDKKTIGILSLGSISGAMLAENVLGFMLTQIVISITKIQNIILSLIFLIIILFLKRKGKTFKIKNKFLIFFIGNLLGFLSVLLGIGGGPLNLAVLMYCFSYSAKESSLYSIVIIFFSQLTKLIIVLFKGQLMTLNIIVVVLIVLSGFFGGFLGTKFREKLSSDNIELLYKIILILLIGISLNNVFRFL